ncbi:hypothetical protein [Microseira sp. BLCC-F43]|uniref:hypothetical protein n=1 Tax=Microseira sp. BLCC-F43 TaxID=3153602 RepID=UPI0035BA3BF0
MQITSISDHPIHEIPYLTAASGNSGVVERILPVLLAEVDFLPPGLDAIDVRLFTLNYSGLQPYEVHLCLSSAHP